MATIARLNGITVDGVGAAQEWKQTPSLGGPTPGAGGPDLVALISPVIDIFPTDISGDYVPFKAAVGGTIKGVFARIITDGAGAGGDVNVFVDLDGTNVTGSQISLLLADTVTGQWQVSDGPITAVNVITAGEIILIQLTEVTAYTAGQIQVVILIEPA